MFYLSSQTPPKVKSFRISAYDYPNVVCGKDLYAGAVTRDSIETREVKYGDRLYLSRVRGIVSEEGRDSMFKLEWIDRDFARENTGVKVILMLLVWMLRIARQEMVQQFV